MSMMFPNFLQGLRQKTWFDGDTYMLEKRAFDALSPHEKAHYMDVLGAEYLSDSVDLASFVPMAVQGDGNCLIHALCKAVCGDGRTPDLREKLTSELVENERFYRYYLKLSDQDWTNSIEAASLDGQYLGSEHIFALSNVLRRPIILLDNKEFVSQYGEGELGTSATFLPTRLPPLAAVPPPLVIAWASAEHRHYVALIPKMTVSCQTMPHVHPLPQMAYPSSLPPGRQISDYVTTWPTLREASAAVELKTAAEVRRKAMKIIGYHDILESSLQVVSLLGLPKRRLFEISNFITALSVAHSVPCFLSDPSYRALQELERVGRFPLAEYQTPPSSPFADMASRVLAAFEEWDKYKAEAGSEVKQAMKEILSKDAAEIVAHMRQRRTQYDVVIVEEPIDSVKEGEAATVLPETEEVKMKTSQEKTVSHPSTWAKFDIDNVTRWKGSKIDIVPYAFLFESLMPEFPKQPIFLGFVSCILTQWPAEPLYELVRECQLPSALVKLVTPETSVGAMTILFRCLASLLNPRLFGSLSFPIVDNPNLKAQIDALLPTYPVLHFPSLSAFLRNYAQYCSHTRLIADSVRDDHARLLLRFLNRAAVEVGKVGPNDVLKLKTAIEDAIIGICSIVIAMPDRAVQIQALIKFENLEAFKKIGIDNALLEEFANVLDKKVKAFNLPKAQLRPT